MVHLMNCCFPQRVVSDQDSRNLQMPSFLLTIFQEHHFNPQNLPELDMEQFRDFADGIKCIKPRHMRYPVMRFTDVNGRSGVALNIQGKRSSTRTWSIHISDTRDTEDMIDPPSTTDENNEEQRGIWFSSIMKDVEDVTEEMHTEIRNARITIRVSLINDVWTIYRQHSSNDPLNSGSFVIGVNIMVASIVQDRHSREVEHCGPWDSCEECPFSYEGNLIHPRLLESLFLGTDPDFQLGEDPNFRLFPERVTVLELPISVSTFLGWLYEKIHVFFMNFMSYCSFCSTNPA